MTQLDLTAHDATAQAEMVQSRAMSARQLVETSLRRIDELEPAINAFRVVTAHQAHTDADRIDSLTNAELAALPLAGVPVAIKDDTDVVGQSTMWGSASDRGVSDHDAEVVRRLRRAGAVIIGKTNVPELTLWPWTASRLRIAVSTNTPPGTHVSLTAARRASIEGAADMLAGLGHDIIEIDIDYGLASLWNSMVRYLEGVHHDASSMPDRRQLEARSRTVARLGRLLPARSLRGAVEHERQITASINRVFDAADVVLTPLSASPAPRIDSCPNRGALRSLRAANTSAWLIPWNLTGQPALTVPRGVDDNYLPTAIHLAGRPNDEATLLALAAQIETLRPFLRWAPPPAEPAR